MEQYVLKVFQISILNMSNKMDYSNIQRQIKFKYKNADRVRFCEKCLEIGTEWANIKMSQGMFMGLEDNQRTRSFLTQDCVEYIKSQVKPKRKTGLFISFILPIILNMIIQWIASLIVDNIFSQKVPSIQCKSPRETES